MNRTEKANPACLVVGLLLEVVLLLIGLGAIVAINEQILTLVHSIYFSSGQGKRSEPLKAARDKLYFIGSTVLTHVLT